ncbi:hypothetical protein [Desulfocicer vacuolatum]|uniref:hypothetical protein n=1 Tax=Desulfocicer vacuolatum TaxID=2298 RepID=UPI001BB08293|nr:hypothetical protein [Desulfocicer vacuolatum]
MKYSTNQGVFQALLWADRDQNKVCLWQFIYNADSGSTPAEPPLTGNRKRPIERPIAPRGGGRIAFSLFVVAAGYSHVCYIVLKIAIQYIK